MTTINVTLGTPHIEVDPVTSQVSIVLAGPQGPQGEPGSGPGGGGEWGEITGTLSDQTDLQAALDDKQDAGAAAGGDLTGTYPNPTFAVNMATQAELDAVSTVANAAIAPGDAAGGDLTGTYPNPTFAVNMATQAELDAVSTVANAAIAPGDAAGGDLTGTYPNPTFAADMATQAELDAKVSDTAYDATSWNGVTGVAPSKNAVRDKIEDILDGVTFSGDISVPDEAYDATNWNGSLEVPTKNAVRDKFESLSVGTVGDCLDIQFVRKPSDETVINSTVIQDDNDLVVAIGASQTWVIRYWLFVTAVAQTAQLDIAITVPASASVIYNAFGPRISTADLLLGSATYQTVSGGELRVGTGVNNALHTIEVVAVVVNSTNAGNVTLQWAQASQQNNNSVVVAGSHLIGMRFV